MIGYYLEWLAECWPWYVQHHLAPWTWDEWFESYLVLGFSPGNCG